VGNGKIFALCSVTRLGDFGNFGQLFENYKSSPNFSRGVVCELIFAKMGWASFWAIFFTNTSDHSGLMPQFMSSIAIGT
jgi:hypothetical protein